jgi:hypothetical protein
MTKPNDKIIESTSVYSVTEAAKIWKSIKELQKPANDDGAITEAELSVLTWLECDSEAVFLRNEGRYQRLNDAVMAYFLEQSRAKQEEYPPLKRFKGKIGKMTVFLAEKDVSARRKTAESHLTKAISINEGMDLGRNIPQEFASGYMDKLISQGYDPKYAAQLAMDIVKEVKINERISDMSRKKLTKMLAKGMVEEFSRSPALIANDKRILALGKKDSLAMQNKNISDEEKKRSTDEA